MKRKIVALMLLLSLLFNSAYVFAETESMIIEETAVVFNDVSRDNSAYEAIMYLAERNILSGKGKNMFYPNDFLKREELAKILTKAFELSESENLPVFSDVPAGEWYAGFVRTIAQSGLMTGFSEKKFGVGYSLSRQDLAVILKRFLDKENVVLDSERAVIFADSSEVAEYAKDAVESLTAMGIMESRAGNCFKPKENATRGETAEAIYKALVIKKEQVDALGRYGDISQYVGPFELPNDRLQEAMPKPFDASTMYGEEIAFEDFEDNNYGILTPPGETAGVTFAKEGGYGGGGCIVIEGDPSGTVHPRFSWKTAPGEFVPGDYFVFTAMIKGENITGSGKYRSILSIGDEKGKWMTESTNQNAYTTSMDWTERTYIVMIPQEVNALTTPEFYTIFLGAYVNNLGGKVYFDNFSLKKIRFDPMNTVLMTPNYKGLIKGEGGIGDISLRAYVDHLNMWDLNTFNFTAQITDEEHNVLMKSESEKVVSVMDVYFSSKDLKMGGDYYLECILTDKETGDQIQKFEWPLHKREADFVTTIGYDEYGRVTKNGEPIFPLSIYNWKSSDDIYDLMDAGCIDNVQQGDYEWAFSFASNDKAQQTIKDLENHNMTINMPIYRSCYSEIKTKHIGDKLTTQGDLRMVLGKLANNFKDLPNLYGYYTFDEQSPLQFGEDLAWNRKIVEYYDMGHPTLCAVDSPETHRPGIYAKTSDFLGYDPYPVTGFENQNIALVYNRITEGKETNPNRPIYAILQGFWYEKRGGLRAPTLEEFRNMAFQAICAGSCMLDCYAYSEMKYTPSPGRTWKDEFAILTDVYSEIQYLEPIILSSLPTPYYEIKGGGKWLNTMSRRYNGKSYLFTVNNEATNKVANFYLDGVSKITGMYSKKVYEADDNGMFEIKWDGYEVEVFEYEQDDYKSSHAELKRFGLSDIIMINSESEEPCFVVPNDMKEAEYGATISDYAELYINGEKVENKGKLSLEGLEKINVKVVSEDGRFKTEKTYRIVYG